MRARQDCDISLHFLVLVDWNTTLTNTYSLFALTFDVLFARIENWLHWQKIVSAIHIQRLTFKGAF